MTAFADVQSITAALGRDLTDLEEQMAEQLLEDATTLIVSAVDKDAAWAEALTPVPKILEVVCRSAVKRVMLNPRALSSFQEQLGAHSFSEGYRNPNTGIGASGTGELALTEREETLVRKEVLGRLSGSACIESIVDDLSPCGPVEQAP